MKKNWKLNLFGTLVFSTTSSLFAADAGDAMFPLDMDDKARAEIIYESLNRDLSADDSLVKYDALEANLLFLRIHTDVGQYAYLDFDIGTIDPDGGDNALYGGIGLRFLTYDSPTWRLTTYGQLHYAPDVQVSDELAGPIAQSSELEYDFMELEAGILASLKIETDNQLMIMPYAGPVLSVIDIDGDVEAAGASEGLDAEEDNLLGLAAGVAFQLPGQNSIRLEGRYFGSLSASVALGIAF